MRTFKSILTAILVFNFFYFLQSCTSADEPISSGEIMTDEEVLQQFLDAGFKIVEPEDSLVPQIRFDSNEEALKFLEEFQKKNLRAGLSRGDILRAKLMYDPTGHDGFYYFSFNSIHVDIMIGLPLVNIKNDINLKHEAFRVSVSHTPLPIVTRDKSATYKHAHTGGFNWLYIVFTEKFTIGVKDITVYQEVDVTNYNCCIDFEHSEVGIKVIKRG